MKKIAALATIALLGLPAFAANKITDTAVIRDVQATNFAPAKKKHQQYDFTLDTVNNSYQCRTAADHSLNATDFPVGTSVNLTVKGKDAEIKTPNKKSAKCRITRVAPLP